MEPMDGPDEAPIQDAANIVPVGQEASAFTGVPAESLSLPTGIPVEPEQENRTFGGIFSTLTRLFVSDSPRSPGWMSRHSSRSRWKRGKNEPYVDLSPLDLTRRH